jgi:hypothetical protein
LVNAFKELFLLSSDFSDQVESFAHLVLLYSYLGVSSNRIEVLFDLKRNLLG